MVNQTACLALLAKFGFFENHVLANPWVVFAEFQFVDLLTGVAFGHIVIAGASRAEQFDQDNSRFCHDEIPTEFSKNKSSLIASISAFASPKMIQFGNLLRKGCPERG